MQTVLKCKAIALHARGTTQNRIVCSVYLPHVLHDDIDYWHSSAAVLPKLLHMAHILEAANQREPWVRLSPNELVIGHAVRIPCGRTNMWSPTLTQDVRRLRRDFHSSLHRDRACRVR